jgi:hypothetical protein
MNRLENYTKGKAVSLAWIDSAVQRGWVSINDVDIAYIKSVGYVFNNDHIALTITTSLDDGEGGLYPVSIPWDSIQQIKEIEDA